MGFESRDVSNDYYNYPESGRSVVLPHRGDQRRRKRREYPPPEQGDEDEYEYEGDNHSKSTNGKALVPQNSRDDRRRDGHQHQRQHEYRSKHRNEDEDYRHSKTTAEKAVPRHHKNRRRDKTRNTYEDNNSDRMVEVPIAPQVFRDHQDTYEDDHSDYGDGYRDKLPHRNRSKHRNEDKDYRHSKTTAEKAVPRHHQNRRRDKTRNTYEDNNSDRMVEVPIAPHVRRDRRQDRDEGQGDEHEDAHNSKDGAGELVIYRDRGDDHQDEPRHKSKAKHRNEISIKEVSVPLEYLERCRRDKHDRGGESRHKHRDKDRNKDGANHLSEHGAGELMVSRHHRTRAEDRDDPRGELQNDRREHRRSGGQSHRRDELEDKGEHREHQKHQKHPSSGRSRKIDDFVEYLKGPDPIQSSQIRSTWRSPSPHHRAPSSPSQLFPRDLDHSEMPSSSEGQPTVYKGDPMAYKSERMELLGGEKKMRRELIENAKRDSSGKERVSRYIEVTQEALEKEKRKEEKRKKGNERRSERGY